MTRAAPRRSPLQVSAPPPRRAHLAIVPPRGTAPRTPPAPMRSSGLLPSGGDSGGACRPPQAPRRGIPAPGLASASPVPIASPGGPRGPYRVLRCAARPPSSHPCCGRGFAAGLPAGRPAAVSAGFAALTRRAVGANTLAQGRRRPADSARGRHGGTPPDPTGGGGHQAPRPPPTPPLPHSPRPQIPPAPRGVTSSHRRDTSWNVTPTRRGNIP